MGDAVINVKGRLTSAAFESKFLAQMTKTLETLGTECGHPSEVCFDLTKLSWIDPLEGLCLCIAADWINRSCPGTLPAFTIYTPDVLLKKNQFAKLLDLDPGDTERASAERSRTKHIVRSMSERVFHRGLWEWRLLHFLRSKDIRLYLSLANQKYPWNDVLFRERSVSSRSRKDPDTILPVTPVLERKDLPRTRERIEVLLGKHVPDSPGDAVVKFSHLVHRLCENICDHAYQPGDPLPKTGAVLVRHLGEGGLLGTVKSRLRSSNLDLKQAQERVFRALQIPDRLFPFWERHYDVPIVEIAVSDGGAGVYTTLRESFGAYQERKDSEQFEVLRYAFRKGSTCKKPAQNIRYGDEELGLGLFKAKEQVLMWDGVLEMRSGQTRITFSRDFESGLPPDPEDHTRQLAYFPGTQIRVLIPERTFGQLSLFR